MMSPVEVPAPARPPNPSSAETKPVGLFVLSPDAFETIYSEKLANEARTLLDIPHPPMAAAAVEENPEILHDVEIILSGWGAPKLTRQFLESAPRLRAVFYGAGSVRGMVTEAVWDRGLVITSAAAMNAVPVAEFTLAQIILALKGVWRHAFAVRDHGRDGYQRHPTAGAYHSRVGLVSLGVIGQLVCKRLRSFDLDVVAYDPFAPSSVFEEYGVARVGLDELFETSDVVSLHTPLLPETVGMITGAHFSRMKPDATFINTSRGDVVNEQDLIDVLEERPDLYAALDVLANHDRGVSDRIFELPNVVITPHIAGSMGMECQRMGRSTLDELIRYLTGEPLHFRVTRENFSRMA